MRIGKQSRVGIRSGQNAPPKHPSFWIMVMMKVSLNRNGIIEDMRKAAEFRGGKCLSPAMTKGDLSTPLDWECQFGHRFKASPTLVLLGGHWCPECLPLPWNYDEIAKGNPFFAQVWYPFHDKKEHNVYDESIFTDFKE